ncbi:hypothetical protein HUJ04_010373 [Dendroctonus ponderosae]|nr:hypothetical protein HUJ04_010373 [Dendroctonus ponderosae]
MILNYQLHVTPLLFKLEQYAQSFSINCLQCGYAYVIADLYAVFPSLLQKLATMTKPFEPENSKLFKFSYVICSSSLGNGIDTSAVSVPAGPSLSETRHFTSKITPPFYNRSSKCSPPLMHAMTRNLFTIHERQNVRVSRFSFDIVMWPDNVLHSLKFIDDNSRKFMYLPCRIIQYKDHTPNVTVSSLRQIKEEFSPRRGGTVHCDAVAKLDRYVATLLSSLLFQTSTCQLLHIISIPVRDQPTPRLQPQKSASFVWKLIFLPTLEQRGRDYDPLETNSPTLLNILHPLRNCLYELCHTTLGFLNSIWITERDGESSPLLTVCNPLYVY